MQGKSEFPEGKDRLTMNLLDQMYDMNSMNHNLENVTQKVVNSPAHPAMRMLKSKPRKCFVFVAAVTVY